MLLIYTHLAQEVESEKVKDNRCCAKVCKCSSNETSAMASETMRHRTYRSWETSLNSPSRPGATCALKPAKRTNCPTVDPNLYSLSAHSILIFAEKQTHPPAKAWKGYTVTKIL